MHCSIPSVLEQPRVRAPAAQRHHQRFVRSLSFVIKEMIKVVLVGRKLDLLGVSVTRAYKKGHSHSVNHEVTYRASHLSHGLTELRWAKAPMPEPENSVKQNCPGLESCGPNCRAVGSLERWHKGKLQPNMKI
jgi:hypothetical protein